MGNEDAKLSGVTKQLLPFQTALLRRYEESGLSALRIRKLGGPDVKTLKGMEKGGGRRDSWDNLEKALNLFESMPQEFATDTDATEVGDVTTPSGIEIRGLRHRDSFVEAIVFPPGVTPDAETIEMLVRAAFKGMEGA